MIVTTSRDQNGKRIRLRSYRCNFKAENYLAEGSERPHAKYMPHQGEREKARRLSRA